MPKQILESDIEKATSEFNVSEDWQVFMDICDRIKTTANGPKESLKSIMKRVNHQIPHVALQALTLLATCVTNCGKPFLLEVSSRDWCNNAKTVITRGHEKVSQRLRELIKKWAEDEFKDDPQLALVVQFYKRLKQDGLSFDFSSDKPNSGLAASLVQGPKVRTDDDLSFKEDLELALAMSMQEAEPNQGHKSSSTPNSSLYPSFSSPAAQQAFQEETELFKVCALYDFEAAEDNEMTFKNGDVFSVLDNSDENWWKGKNHLGVGLFPANFVTSDLSVPDKSEKKVRFADSGQGSQLNSYQDPQESSQTLPQQRIVKKKAVLSEDHLNSTLSMLKNASPNEIDDEEGSILAMEETSREMGTLIEKKILGTERRKDDLSDLNDKFLQALQMYQQLMKEPMSAPVVAPMPPQQMGVPGGLSQQQMYHLANQSPQHSLQYQPYSQQQQHQYPTQTYSHATVPPQYQGPDPRLYQQPPTQPPAGVAAQQPHPPAHPAHLQQPQHPQSPAAMYVPQQQDPAAQYSQQQQQQISANYRQQQVVQPPQQPTIPPQQQKQQQQQQYSQEQFYQNTIPVQYAAGGKNNYMGYDLNASTQQHAQTYQQTSVYQ